jgi:hypothetical protein
MKAQFMKMGGCKTEQEFYNKYPNEATFFEAFPAAAKMCRGGRMQLGGNPPDFGIPPDVNTTGEYGQPINLPFGQVYQGLMDKYYAGPNTEEPEGFVNPDLGLAKRLKEMGYPNNKIIQVLKGKRESVLPGRDAPLEKIESLGIGALPIMAVDITPDMVIKPTKVDYNKMKFADAFRTARTSGETIFTWHGKKYGTQLKGESTRSGSYQNDMPDMRHRTFRDGGSAQPIDPYKSYANPKDMINKISQWMYQDGGVKKATQFPDEVGQKRLGQVLNFIQSNNMRAAADEEAQQMYFQMGGNPYGYKPNPMIGAYDQAIAGFSNPNAFGNFVQASENLGNNSWMETTTDGTIGMAAYGGNLPMAQDGTVKIPDSQDTNHGWEYPISEQELKAYDNWKNSKKHPQYHSNTQGANIIPANYQNIIKTRIQQGQMPDWSKVRPTKWEDKGSDYKKNWFRTKVHTQGTLYFDPITGEQKSTAGDASQSSVNPTQREEEITGNISKSSVPATGRHDYNTPWQYWDGKGVGKSTFNMNKSQPSGSGYKSAVNPFLNQPNNTGNPTNPFEYMLPITPMNPYRSNTPNNQFMDDGSYGDFGNDQFNGVDRTRSYTPNLEMNNPHQYDNIYNRYKGIDRYKVGGEHEMSHKELMAFMAAGGQVDILE